MDGLLVVVGSVVIAVLMLVILTAAQMVGYWLMRLGAWSLHRWLGDR